MVILLLGNVQNCGLSTILWIASSVNGKQNSSSCQMEDVITDNVVFFNSTTAQLLPLQWEPGAAVWARGRHLLGAPFCCGCWDLEYRQRLSSPPPPPVLNLSAGSLGQQSVAGSLSLSTHPILPPFFSPLHTTPNMSWLLLFGFTFHFPALGFFLRPWGDMVFLSGGRMVIHSEIGFCSLVPLGLGFPRGSAGKESACNAGDLGSIPGLGRSPGEGKSNPLQYSGLENSMDYTTQSWTRLSDFHFHFPLGLSFTYSHSSGPTPASPLLQPLNVPTLPASGPLKVANGGSLASFCRGL